MELNVNGTLRTFPETVRTVRDLLVEMNLADAFVAVEVNRGLVTRQEHETFVLHAGDFIEVVTLVGGG
ncbi:MAG: sulfur carrier protein ThiS [Planctomycetia bacterium]|nr:sulfur carrier protein ThiS [Planctomycetia bacterium]